MKNSLTGWHVASVMAPIVDSDPVNGHRYQGWRPCIDWCRKQLGDCVIDGWRFIGEGVFEFKHEKDLLLFLLRWGS